MKQAQGSLTFNTTDQGLSDITNEVAAWLA